jgi:hypothetical protein
MSKEPLYRGTSRKVDLSGKVNPSGTVILFGLLRDLSLET